MNIKCILHTICLKISISRTKAQAISEVSGLNSCQRIMARAQIGMNNTVPCRNVYTHACPILTVYQDDDAK